MAAYYNGGRTMSYSNTDGCFDGGRTMYSNTTEECYEAPKHGHGHGHDHGHGHGHDHGHGHGMTNMYSNTTTDECYDGGRNGRGGMNMYSNTTDVECFEGGRHGHGHGGGGRVNMYSNTTEEECYGGGQQQGYYKKEEKTHKNRERMGEVGALATGAFALYEGYEVKKDPAHAQRHKIEAGLAGAAAVGAGGYAYHEHREQKQASYGGGAHHQEYRAPAYNQYCN